jgi:hypothetical protein
MHCLINVLNRVLKQHHGVSAKKGGTKRLSKVWERIGRLKEQYPSVHKYYDISIQDNGKSLATGMTYQKKPGTSQA